MRMNIQVTYIFKPIISHKVSFCHRGKSKLVIGLFIHELLREPLSFKYEREGNKTFIKIMFCFPLKPEEYFLVPIRFLL